jgi:3-phenylpropionate/trans-cinnamate dioxygenase ferredoxin subunit
MTEIEGYVRVMPVDEIEEGAICSVEVDEEERILVKVNGQVYALCGICTHEEALLADGDLEEDTVWCPLHSSGFNVRNGTVTNPPAVVPLETYDVRVEGGDVYVSREPRPKPKKSQKPKPRRRW